MHELTDLRGEQARQLLDAEQVFAAYAAGRAELAHRYAGAMSWKRIAGREYLHRKKAKYRACI